MKIFKRLLLTLLIVVAGTIIYNYPKLNIISGFAAKNMASSVFIASHTEATISENDNNVSLIKLAETQVNGKEAISTIFGLMERRAIDREGLGCVLVNDDYDYDGSYVIPKRTRSNNALPFPYGNVGTKDTVFGNVDYKELEKALDNAFSDPETKKTRTVLVVYKDFIIGERYIDGFTKDTKILGWSMTKSILATLYGILEYDGKIDLDRYHPYKVHKDPKVLGEDPREAITLNHLLRMQSGLAWDEDYSTISDVTKMLFLDTDMAQAQAKTEIIAKPVEIWNYSSGTSNLLSGILRKQFATYQEYLDFPYASLIDRIGMHSMLIETDMAGNFVGSSYGWANTRDWAKFGLLYLHKGNWNGEQLFDPSWVDYVTDPTVKSDGTYGAHFWLNAEGKYPDVPRDLFSANGFQGQRVFMIPSKNLVVVRTGLAGGPDFDINVFLSEIIASIGQ